MRLFLNQLQRALIAVLLFVAVCLLPAPAQAQTSPLSVLQANLSAALCRNEWNSALTALQQMIGSDDTSALSRQQLIALRYQLEDYRARNAQFDQSSNPACAAAIAAAHSPAPAATQTFDWEQALQAFATRPSPSPSSGSGGCSDPSTVSSDGRCFRNPIARARHERSWGLGDRPANAALN